MLVDQVRLMVLTDASLLKGRDVVDVCRRAVVGGATSIQVRWKPAPAREVADVARALVSALSIPVLVNDRIDVALAVGAAGVHLGQDDAPAGAGPSRPTSHKASSSVSPWGQPAKPGWRTPVPTTGASDPVIRQPANRTPVRLWVRTDSASSLGWRPRACR